MLRFRDLGCFVFDLGCFIFEIWVLRFRVLGASFSSFGCFVLQSSFSSASFSKLPNATSNLYREGHESFLYLHFGSCPFFCNSISPNQ